MKVSFQTRYSVEDLSVSEFTLLKSAMDHQLDDYKATSDADPVTIAKYEKLMEKLHDSGSFERII
jgi:hypothetical protein